MGSEDCPDSELEGAGDSETDAVSDSVGLGLASGEIDSDMLSLSETVPDGVNDSLDDSEIDGEAEIERLEVKLALLDLDGETVALDDELSVIDSELLPVLEMVGLADRDCEGLTLLVSEAGMD